MTFLAPVLLFGTALAAAPVIIHLLNRRKFARIPWAAMDFLAEVKAETARRLRLEEIILLAVRTLIILLVALAAARPVLSSGKGGVSGAVILVDKSASMRYAGAAGTLFDAAKARAREIAAALPDGAPVLVGVFDSVAEIPSDAQPLADRNAALAALDGQECGWSGTGYSAALAAAARASKAFASPPAVFIVSDFRKGGGGLESRPAIGPLGPVCPVPVTKEDGVNVGIADVSPAGKAFTAAGNQLAVSLVNSTGRPASVPLTVTVDGAPAGAIAAGIPGAGRVSAAVQADALKWPGLHRVEVSIPPDAYDGDSKAFAVIARRPLSVRVLADGDARKFLLAALTSAPPDAFVILERDSDAPGAAVAQEGFIVASAPSGAVAAQVWERVRSGAFLVFFLDPWNLDAGAAFLQASGDAGLSALVAARSAVAGQFHPELNGVHAVTGFIRETADLSLSAVTLERAANLGIPAGGAVETPLVVDVGGAKTTFLVLTRVGEGRAAIFNCAADRSSGNLPVTPFFVPLVFESLAWACGDEARAPRFFCGEPAALPVRAGRAAVTVRGPAGEFAVKTTAAAGGVAAVFIPREPGFYSAEGTSVAVNVPPGESDLRLADEGQIEKALGGTVIAGPDFVSEVARGTTGFELSPALFAAALCLIAVEMAIVYFLKRL